jgi:hypothetical protein
MSAVIVPDDLSERFDSLAEAITKAIGDHPEGDCSMIAYVLLHLGGKTAGINALPIEAMLPIVFGSYHDGTACRSPGLH